LAELEVDHFGVISGGKSLPPLTAKLDKSIGHGCDKLLEKKADIKLRVLPYERLLCVYEHLDDPGESSFRLVHLLELFLLLFSQGCFNL